MSELFDTFQSGVVDTHPDYAALRQRLREQQRTVVGVDLARSRGILRLCQALQDLGEGRAGTADVAVLLRQVIRAYNRRLELPHSLWQLLHARDAEVGLRATATVGPDRVEITVDPWTPAWLPDASSIDALEPRRQERPEVGDGLFYAMSGYDTYQSEAQKAAVDAWLFAAPGSTTLVTLPTGAGKSMCTALPAWFASQGGKIPGGTTLVVVPTVALALDQEAQSQRFFEGAIDHEYRPLCLTASTPLEQRAVIWRGIRNGTLPLLFTSPEALMQSGLYDLCLQAAAEGKLLRLVIDEAHLVETWGAGFRTEFQFLAAYRTRLLMACQGRLRTLLLSATVTQSCEHVLEQLFGQPEGLCQVRANRLRPEPAYWFSSVDDRDERQRRVLEALYHLPRPAILYVTQPEDADAWVLTLRDAGFERVAAFSGKTDSDERTRLMDEWRRDRRDVMVATSAFGVGIDKPDVRTVIHACLPENVDRFYQEVGRSGRDGFSSISLLCYAKGDEKIAFDMAASARITPKKAYQRWRGMVRRQQYVGSRGDEILVDVNSTPANDPEMRQSQINREWNEHTLLLMRRAGILDIADTRPEELDAMVATEKDTNAVRLHIRILRLLAASDQGEFMLGVEQIRKREQEQVWQAVLEMRDLARMNANASMTHCLAHRFAALYPATALACGGCPFDRREHAKPYVHPLHLEMDVRYVQPKPASLHGDLGQLLSGRNALIAHWDGPPTSMALEPFAPLLAELVAAGMQQLLVPATLFDDSRSLRRFMESLARQQRVAHLVLPGSWILRAHSAWPLFKLPTVVLYPPNNDEADQLYRVIHQQQYAQSDGMPIIHIIHQALFLESEYGRFIERVDALSIDVARLREMLEASQDFPLF